MKVALRIDGPARGWHRRLGEAMAAAGHALVLVQIERQHAMPWGLGLLLAAEHRLYGAVSPLFAPAPAAFETSTDATLVLEARFDGRAGEGGLLTALLAGRAPRIEVVAIEGENAMVRVVGLPALEHPHTFARSLEMVLTRTIQIAVQATRAGDGALPALSEAQTQVASAPVLFLLRHLARRLRRRLGPPGGRQEHWAIALRRVGEADAVASARAWQPPDFATLPHDGRRFQADPFPFTHDGRDYVFFEDFPYATRKGVIAMVELDAAGRASPMRVVLERPEHLSYPFVFAHEGETYMLPEMSAARRVQLFRADPFPDRWVADHVLIDGAVIADATLIEHDGRWWLFGTQSGDSGSSWDALALFHAPHPFGPWTPNAGNPVLIDAGAARPADTAARSGWCPSSPRSWWRWATT